MLMIQKRGRLQCPTGISPAAKLQLLLPLTRYLPVAVDNSLEAGNRTVEVAICLTTMLCLKRVLCDLQETCGMPSEGMLTESLAGMAGGHTAPLCNHELRWIP